MRTWIAALAVAASWPATARADQLMCNDRAVAEKAAQMLAEGTVLLDFCSQCEDRVRVVRVRAAAAVEDCQWQLEVAGRVLWESERRYEAGYDESDARFSRDGSRYLRRLDLAYAYVEVAPNQFRWLGGALGLPAKVNTESISLPGAISEALGPRPLVKIPQRLEPPSAGSTSAPPSSDGPKADGPTAESSAPGASADASNGAGARVPTTQTVAALFDYWRRGGREGQGRPVLGHFLACLRLDLKKGSPTRYECLEPVEGAVRPGTKVYAWADWLVPRGSSFDDVAIAFVYDGEVRLRRPLSVRGRRTSPVVPTTIAAQLSQRGIYTLRLTEGARTLREVRVEVR